MDLIAVDSVIVAYSTRRLKAIIKKRAKYPHLKVIT